MTERLIYAASSWRNKYQPDAVMLMRGAGHRVYDFRNPRVDGPVMPDTPDSGFSWRDIDPDWKHALPSAFRKMLEHPIAQEGFDSDFNAMKWADTCVIILPCGRSAHLEAGWMAGAGQKLIIYMPEIMVACRTCLGTGQVDYGDNHHGMDLRLCGSCEGRKLVLEWRDQCEPELMYKIAGKGPIVVNEQELLEALR